MASIQVGKTVQYNGQVFERIRVLGKGSFGTAIVHRRQHDNALVVLKEIDLVELRRDADRLSAIQEARIMSNLSHHNIIKYYNAYTTDTKLIIEMEYARLGNLQAYLAYQNRLLGEREVFQIFRQVLFGLDYLHSKKIVHLDLKMANIFVTSEGSIKLGDFGIAKFINSSSDDSEDETRAGLKSGPRNPCKYHVGTLAYSSPERCLGEETDFKSDIWSLGCILYELATLKPLFASESLAELVLSITRVQYEPIQRSDIRPAIKSLFERMITRQPSDRPTSRELISLTDRILLQIDQLALAKRRQTQQNINHPKNHLSTCSNEASDPGAMVSDAAAPIQLASDDLLQSSPINYKHSLLYQVRLDSHDIQVERVNLPQSKRIREIVRGRSHYLALTYDDIVYGWGNKHKGQLGACNLFRMSHQQQQQQHPASPRSPSLMSRSGKMVRHSQSARASLTARDLQIPLPSSWTTDAGGRSSYSPFGGCPTGGRVEPKISSLTQPPSLSSSTQTILAPNGQPQRQSLSNLMADYQTRRSQEQHFELLAASQPAIRPIVISELNKRRICRVAAGRDFSVFLSRTGIVLTCGDGSRGCLGRGNLASTFMPCMVDKLLNMDVVSIACGPEHVVAICSNGQAFAWGNSQHDRLGVSLSDVSNRDVCASHYVTRPQLISFDLLSKSGRKRQTNEANRSKVFIKSAHCGDRCTVFIDSNQKVWACGLNSSNRLGLDRVRRFKRTVIVEHAPKPIKVAVLSKERIVSCSIGKNHTSYITIEGKMLVLGQDIDHSYRLKMELASENNDESLLKRGANGLQRLSSSWSLTSNQVYIKRHTKPNNGTSELIRKLDHESLVKSLLNNDRLRGFKTAESLSGMNHLSNKHHRTSRFARNQVETYLTKSRALRRLPFDGVLATSSTSKFTLVLTNDNRIYFWGTRTHDSDDCSEMARQIDQLLGPRLIPSQLDDCFIKIGAVNSSLMESIQVLGSDQPIILARNPKLTARSLKDLWILDYELLEGPQTPCDCYSSGSISSHSASLCGFDIPQPQPLPDSCTRSLSRGSYVGQSGTGGSNSFNAIGSSCSSLQSLEQTTTSLYSCCSNEEHCEGKMNHTGNFIDYKRHDAIIEPQPIFSLYVPSMFNHSGCALQLVNLFCFDEDRFFLVLDTTVKYHSQSNLTPAIETSAKSIATQRRNSVSHRHLNNYTNQVPTMQQTSRKLNIVEEQKSCGSSSMRPKSFELNSHNQLAPRSSTQNDFIDHTNNLLVSSKHNDEDSGDHSDGLFVRLVPGNGRDLDEYRHEDCEANELTGSFNGALTQESQQVSPISNNCLSLEEPVSMSTFAPGFDGNNIAILGRESSESDCEYLRRLSFERSQQVFVCELAGGDDQRAQEDQERKQDYSFAVNSRQNHHRRRLFKRTRNQSESTVVTGSFEDDTTTMPTWVKNEYHQQVFSINDDQNNQGIGEDKSLDNSANTLIEPEDNQFEEDSFNVTEGRPRLIGGCGDCDCNIIGNLEYASESSSRVLYCLGPALQPNDSASNSHIDAKLTTQQVHRLSSSQPELRTSGMMTDSSSLNIGRDYGTKCKLAQQNLLDCRVYSFEQAKDNKESVEAVDNQAILDGSSHQTHDRRSDKDCDSVSQRIDSNGNLDLNPANLTNSLSESFGLVCSLTKEKTSAASRVSGIHAQSAEDLSFFDNFDLDFQDLGLRRNLLSRSINLGSDCYSREGSLRATNDMNDNLNHDDRAIGSKTRRRSRFGGSRSSLGSIRKSLARLFC